METTALELLIKIDQQLEKSNKEVLHRGSTLHMEIKKCLKSYLEAKTAALPRKMNENDESRDA